MGMAARGRGKGWRLPGARARIFALTSFVELALLLIWTLCSAVLVRLLEFRRAGRGAIQSGEIVQVVDA